MPWKHSLSASQYRLVRYSRHILSIKSETDAVRSISCLSLRLLIHDTPGLGECQIYDLHENKSQKILV